MNTIRSIASCLLFLILTSSSYQTSLSYQGHWKLLKQEIIDPSGKLIFSDSTNHELIYTLTGNKFVISSSNKITDVSWYAHGTVTIKGNQVSETFKLSKAFQDSGSNIRLLHAFEELETVTQEVTLEVKGVILYVKREVKSRAGGKYKITETFRRMPPDWIPGYPVLLQGSSSN